MVLEREDRAIYLVSVGSVCCGGGGLGFLGGGMSIYIEDGKRGRIEEGRRQRMEFL